MLKVIFHNPNTNEDIIKELVKIAAENLHKKLEQDLLSEEE